MLDERLKMYEDAFGESFPTFNFMHMNDDQIGQIIDSCLSAGKDAYELGYVKDDPDIKY